MVQDTHHDLLEIRIHNKSLSLQNIIWEYCIRNYVIPARAQNQSTVSIRLGDLPAKLAERQTYTLIGLALKSVEFEEKYRIRLLSVNQSEDMRNIFFNYFILP